MTYLADRGHRGVGLCLASFLRKECGAHGGSLGILLWQHDAGRARKLAAV